MQLFSIIDDIQSIEKNEYLESKSVFDLCAPELKFFLNQKDLYKVVHDKNIDTHSLYVLSILLEKEIFEKHLNRNYINREERSILFTNEMYQSLCKSAKENGKFRSHLGKIYQYKNELFDIPVFRVNNLRKYGIEINESYFDYLYEYISPDYLNNSISTLSMLAVYDESNKKMFDVECDKVIVYKETNEIYDNFVDAILSNYDHQYEMNLLSLHKQGIYPQKRIPQKSTNFCVTIKPASRVGENAKITELRKMIGWIYSWKNGKNPQKDFNELRQRNPMTEYNSVEAFKKQWVKNQAFKLASTLSLVRADEPKEKKHCLNLNEYVNNLNSLLNRYSRNNVTVFEKVDDLNNYDGYTGIYVLCFDEELRMYIGQTKESFKRRITSHFTNPQSEFDKTHDFDKISSIYVLHTTDEFIDYIEMDCIATISSKYLFNKFAGGGSLELITSNRYDSKKYILSQQAIEDIINDTNYVKQFNNDMKKL